MKNNKKYNNTIPFSLVPKLLHCLSKIVLIKLFKGLHTLPESVVPVVTYSNAATDKARILAENRKKSGIYKFQNLITGKVYIGSAQNISKRFSQYSRISCLKINTTMYICRALLKYGNENFSFEILEYCGVKDLMEREGYYLNLFERQNVPLYNIATAPTAPMAGRKHSPKTIQQMSDAKIGLQAGENNPFSGQKHSDEILIKMSEAQKGEYNSMHGKNHSAETRKKMSDAKLGKAKPEGSGRPCQAIEVFDIKNNLTTQYDSIRAAARALAIPCDSIRSTFRKNRQKPYKNRYIFKRR